MKKLYIYFLIFCSLICAQLNAQEKQQHFDDILLIINYNHPHYISIPTLKEIYGKYFKHIIFYGPAEHPEVILCEHQQGFFSYQTITDAMNRFPHFAGYLYTHDDCIINPWNFIGYDKNKIWFPYWKKEAWVGNNPMYSLTWPIFNLRQQSHATWYWWGSQWGRNPVSRALKQYPAQYKEILVKNIGAHRAIGAYADIVYIPQSLRNSYIQLANIFLQHRAFLEIALPTICHSIADSRTWQRLEGYCWSGPVLQSYDIDFNHPYKLSSLEIRTIVKEFFDQAPAPQPMQEALQKVALRSRPILDKEQQDLLTEGMLTMHRKIVRKFMGL